MGFKNHQSVRKKFPYSHGNKNLLGSADMTETQDSSVPAALSVSKEMDCVHVMKGGILPLLFHAFQSPIHLLILILYCTRLISFWLECSLDSEGFITRRSIESI